MTANKTAIAALGLIQDAEFYLRRELQNSTFSPGPNMTAPGTDMHTPQNGNSQSRGKAVLTILYLSLVALCFIVPVFYYIRLRCFADSARRELELDFNTALEQSTEQQEDTRAARRKYVEERRARIWQLFEPVRMTLKEEHFVRKGVCDGDVIIPVGKSDETVTMATEGEDGLISPHTSDEDDSCLASENADDVQHNKDIDQMERGTQSHSKEVECGGDEHDCSSFYAVEEAKTIDPYSNDENVLVRLPKPGLNVGSASLFVDPTKSLDDCEDREMRTCQGLCSICLCSYKVSFETLQSTFSP